MKNINPLLEAISSISKLHQEWSNILPRNPLLELNRQMHPPESIVSLNKLNTQIAMGLSQSPTLATTIAKQFKQQQKVLSFNHNYVRNWTDPAIELSKSINSLISSDIYKKASNIRSNNLTVGISNTLQLIKEIQSSVSFLSKGINHPLQEYFSRSISLYTQIALQNEDSQTVEDELNTILEVLPANNFEKITIETLQEINSKLNKSSSWALRYFLISLIVTFLLGFYTNEIKDVTTNILFNANNEESKEFSKMLKILCLQERIAKSNTFLRGKPCVNSGTVCSITQGQKVVVQQINHKWIYIIYQDSSYLVKSGWALKKHFEILDSNQ